MAPICLFFFFLGLVVAPAIAVETTSGDGLSGDFTTVTPLDTTIDVTGTTSNISVTDMNTTEDDSTILLSTMQYGGGSSKSTSPIPTPTPKPSDLSKTTTSVTKTKPKDKQTTAKPANWAGNDSTGIIILVVIIVVALGFGVACLLRNRRRQNSVDFSSRPDEANIPLSTVEPIDAVPQNGLQTFESTETTKEPEEPEAKPGAQEEQKAEAGKSVVDPSAESAAPVPTPDSSEDKPKEDVVEKSPPAPVESSVEEKTDDEGVVSNKTSVESLKETNENNSNNAAFSQTRDTKRSINFWDVPLDCPV